MSGHNKWSTIKHKKGAADAKRGKVFTKIIKEISVAAKLGGGDPAANPRLRTAIDKAKGENMPKDNIERAIKKGAGGMEGVNYEETTYEGYGPGGVAVLVEVMTDNRNRTVSDVRSIFTKCNGNMGETGCVSWIFDKKGLIIFPKSVDFDKLFEAAIEAGADDVTEQDEQFEVTTEPSVFMEIRDALANAGFKVDSAEITMMPQTLIKLEGKQAESMLKMMDKLEDNDDVQNVYANFDISMEEMEADVMVILGIDPGSRITGYGIIRKEGNRLIHIDNGALFTDSAADFPGRLKRIFEGLTEIITRYTPQAFAVEDIFFSNNVQSALKLGQARGAAIVAAVNAGVPVFEYSALQVKQSVVGHGKAEKEQVQQMVKILLGLPEIAQADASDALAVAICHANSSLLKTLTANLSHFRRTRN